MDAFITRRSLLWSSIALSMLAAASPNSRSFAADSVDPLPSWNDGAAKRSITDFVARVTTPGDPSFLPAERRIAVFDNDGTLWCEQPMYVQLAFAVDRVKTMAADHPDWKDKPALKAALDGSRGAPADIGYQGAIELVMATHAGMTTDEFAQIVTDWLATARHPRFDRLYTELVYQPMLELLAHLRSVGFRTFIVSGGGADFMRPWSQTAYGVPPHQVIGSTIETRFEMRHDTPVLSRRPKIEFIDDGPGKPVGIHRAIGQRPVAAFGNSDGDLEMLQWTTRTAGPSFGLLIHHTDSEREYTYDRTSAFGRLDRALDAAAAEHWTVVDMKNDWNRVFSFQ
jgi:phosphoserine phosphatase